MLTNLAATLAAVWSLDIDVILRVLAGAVPGVVMALLSVGLLVSGLGALVFGFMLAPALAAGGVGIALLPGAAVLAAATFNGWLASGMTFAGVTAAALVNTRGEPAARDQPQPTPSPTTTALLSTAMVY